MPDRSILAAVADDQSQRDVVATGLALAEATGLRAMFVHVGRLDLVPSSSVLPVGGAAWAPFPEGEYEDAQHRAAERARRFIEEIGIMPADARIGVGDPATELRRIASEVAAEAIVVGRPEAGGLADARSVTRSLSQEGECPVVVARPGADLRLGGGPVLCGIEPAHEDAPHVARAAARFATMLRRPLVIAHVGDFGDAAPRLSYEALLRASHRSTLQALHRVVDELPDGLGLEIALESGTPADGLARMADERDAPLIVVGCRGRGAVRSALGGSVSLDLTRSASRALAVVPRPGGDEHG